MSSKEECSEYQMENNLFGDKKKDGFRLMYNDNTNEDVQQLADVSLSSS